MRTHAIVGLCALLTTAPGAAQDDAMSEGSAVYDYWCATCHAPGPNMPGTQALEVKYNGEIPAVLLERPGLTPEYIAAIVRSGISVMPPFRKTEITDQELAALGEYIAGAAAPQ